MERPQIQPKPNPAENAPTEREQEFKKAVERIYQKYGNDLSAFNRDVQRELELIKRG